MNAYRQQQDRRTQDIQAARQREEKSFDNQQRYGGQDQALRQQASQPQGQAIPLNRAGGESYDQGQQMTMEDAIRIASQYGAVPSRISSGAADPNTGYMGVWAIPTAQGWVPLTRGGAQSAPPTGSPTSSYAASDPSSASDRARGAYGPGATPQPAPQAAAPPSAGGVLSALTGQTTRAQGPPTQAGVYPQPGPQGQGASLSTPNVNVVVNNTPQQQRPDTRPEFTYPMGPTAGAVSAGVPPAAYPGRAMSSMSNSQYPYSPSYTGDQYGSSAAAEAAFNSSRRLDVPSGPPASYSSGIPQMPTVGLPSAPGLNYGVGGSGQRAFTPGMGFGLR